MSDATSVTQIGSVARRDNAVRVESAERPAESFDMTSAGAAERCIRAPKRTAARTIRREHGSPRHPRRRQLSMRWRMVVQVAESLQMVHSP